MSMTPEHTFHDDPEGYICALQNRIDAQAAEIATLKAENERLRTKLSALREAVLRTLRVLENIKDTRVAEWDDWETAMRESYPAYIKDMRCQAQQGLDALTAALEAAKEDGNG